MSLLGLLASIGAGAGSFGKREGEIVRLEEPEKSPLAFMPFFRQCEQKLLCHHMTALHMSTEQKYACRHLCPLTKKCATIELVKMCPHVQPYALKDNTISNNPEEPTAEIRKVYICANLRKIGS